MIRNSKIKIGLVFVGIFGFASVGMAHQGKSKLRQKWEKECSLKLRDLMNVVEGHTFLDTLFIEAEEENIYSSGETYREAMKDLPAKTTESLHRLYLSRLSETQGGTPEFPEAKKNLEQYAYTCNELLSQFKEITRDSCSEADAEYAENAVHVLKLLQKELKSVEQRLKASKGELIVVSGEFKGSFDAYLKAKHKVQEEKAARQKKEKIQEAAANNAVPVVPAAEKTCEEPSPSPAPSAEIVVEKADNGSSTASEPVQDASWSTRTKVMVGCLCAAAIGGGAAALWYFFGPAALVVPVVAALPGGSPVRAVPVKEHNWILQNSANFFPSSPKRVSKKPTL